MAREVVAPVDEETPSGGKRGVVSFFRELPVLIALALGIALLIKAFLVQAFFIPSASMEPTLQIGDRVLVNKLTYRFREPRRGDVVVFRDPFGDPCAKRANVILPEECNKNLLERSAEWVGELFGLPTGETKDFIKRIVALPGETIEMRDGEVFVDGKKIDFPSTPTEGPQEDNYSMPPFKVPAGQYWVLGDNRGNSSDSRTFRGVEEEKIVGKAFVVVWPPGRFGGL